MATQASQLLAEYSADHQNAFNRLMHSLCVPLIAIAIIGLLWAIPVPRSLAAASPWLNFGTAGLLGLTVYYLRLAPRLGIGMLLVALVVAPAAGVCLRIARAALAERPRGLHAGLDRAVHRSLRRGPPAVLLP